ncbi:MAG: hypothetical protein AVDCRST_MAG20-1113 [uncultured Acidimicrobiales bacterium]|uniref:Uncharacterized protein n=1 Tax=uncultured Acidimicrobiales bacterium TaxID=310071 RepID=A0A6J4HQ16_9ACTN|nr:MAG: hypothetical protein AVDCRST_MAG20-1113 [uncultured Acidimicrobiales bacterium]
MHQVVGETRSGVGDRAAEHRLVEVLAHLGGRRRILEAGGPGRQLPVGEPVGAARPPVPGEPQAVHGDRAHRTGEGARDEGGGHGQAEASHVPARSALEREGEALVGGDHLFDPGVCRCGPGAGEECIHLVVAVRRVVVEQRQALGPADLGDVHRVVDAAVAPVRLLLELLRGVLGVVDEEVDPVAELEHRVGDVEGATQRSLVVGEVGDGDAVPADPVAVGGTAVGDAADLHLGVADRHVPVVHVVEGDVTPEVGRPHGEVGRAHELVEGVLERLAPLRRAVDVEAGADAVDGHEERQALDVVPVEVGEEGRAREGAVDRLRLAPEAQPGAEVEDDRRLPRHLERDAGRVAAVAHVPCSWARGRAPHAVERHVQVDPLPPSGPQR